jgi:hypothetical protein
MNSEENQVPEANKRDLQSAETIETLEDVELLSEADPRANSADLSDIWWDDDRTPIDIDVESEVWEVKPEARETKDKEELIEEINTPQINLEPEDVTSSGYYTEQESIEEINTPQTAPDPEIIISSDDLNLTEEKLNEEINTPQTAPDLEITISSDTAERELNEEISTPQTAPEPETITSSNDPVVEEMPETLETEDNNSLEAWDSLKTVGTPQEKSIELDLNPPIESEPELFTDRWLDEPKIVDFESNTSNIDSPEVLTGSIAELERKKARLQAEIKDIQLQKEQLLLEQTKDTRETIGKMVEEGMKELKERKNILQIDIEKLERRRERIDREMRTNFAGVSQDLAVRVQGFKEYLVGSLQDLAISAEQLELSRGETVAPPEKRERRDRRDSRDRMPQAEAQPLQPQFTEQAFDRQTKAIRQLLDRYRTRPDYYGAPWQLRRTFEPIHAEKVQKWFFERGGRGAIESMNSRLQNILVASAIISILHELYGDRARTLVLIDTPEKLGEWRRGLQDCLGISRSDFGTDRGIVLFDSAEVLVQRADRSIQDKLMPLIIIDETEELVNLALLKFPLLLAFTSQPKPSTPSYLY